MGTPFLRAVLVALLGIFGFSGAGITVAETAANKTDAAEKKGKAGGESVVADVSQLDFSKLGELGGKTIFAQICATCHGVNGEGNPLLKSPSIAGMPSYYLVSQFGKFRTGVRGTHLEDIPGMQMRAIAIAVDDGAVEKVAAHIESMEKFPTVNRLGGDPKKGKVEFAERCMACHRFNGTGEIVFGSPPLVSLPDWYLFKQLRDFRDDRRGAAEGDENGLKMRTATDGLDDNVLKDIVAYIGELAAGREPKGSIWR